jgi:hypothetical protein
MKGTRGNLFSQNRILLFTGTAENIEPNVHFNLETQNQ